MAKYSEEIAAALEAISEAGGTYTMTRGAKVFNPQTGQASDSGDTTQSVRAVVLPWKRGETQFDDQYREQIIKGRVKYVLIAASGLTYAPINGDRLTVKSESYHLIGVTELDPASDGAIIYKAAGVRE